MGGCISNQEFNLEVIRTQHLQGMMRSMTRYSDNSVAIGYEDGSCIDIINSVRYQDRDKNIPTEIRCYDALYLPNGSLCVSTNSTEAYFYDRSRNSRTINRVKGNSIFGINISSLNEILFVNGEKKVYRYSHTTETPECIETDKEAAQVSITRTGLIVTSSCIFTNPSVVQFYESETKRFLNEIEAPADVLLYAAVDAEDRVFVASVDRNSRRGNVVFSLYDIRGESVTERDIKIDIPNLACDSSWCYLVSLSAKMLAFACGKKLFFIKVSL